jgi:uncharacterized membrane protein YphA (DoxX/SURF4 family)
MIDRKQFLDSFDRRLTAWMADHGVLLLRLSLGVIFLWFGALKFFPGLSPAQDLAARTIDAMTFGNVPMRAAIVILAAWECLIGIGLLVGKMLRFTLLLLWLQMLGTVTPAFLFPAEVFVHFPYALTLEGQYIVKNLVLVTAGLVIGATVRGGGLTPEAAGSQSDAPL